MKLSKKDKNCYNNFIKESSYRLDDIFDSDFKVKRKLNDGFEKVTKLKRFDK